MDNERDSSPSSYNRRLVPVSLPVSNSLTTSIPNSPVRNGTTSPLRFPNEDPAYFNMTSPSSSSKDLICELKAGKPLRPTQQSTGLTTIFSGSGRNNQWLNTGKVPLHGRVHSLYTKPSNPSTAGKLNTDRKSSI